MKVIIEEITANQEEELILRCHKINNETLKFVEGLKERNN